MAMQNITKHYHPLNQSKTELALFEQKFDYLIIIINAHIPHLSVSIKLDIFSFISYNSLL